MRTILGEEKPYLLFKELYPHEERYKWLIERAKKISWGNFYTYVPWDYFRRTEPFQLYASTSERKTLSVFKDFSPMRIGVGYIVKIILLFHYGIIYIFVPNGEEGWYNKAIHDMENKITKKVLMEKLKDELSSFPFDKTTNNQKMLTLDDIVQIKYGSFNKKNGQKMSAMEIARLYNFKDSRSISYIQDGLYWKFI